MPIRIKINETIMRDMNFLSLLVIFKAFISLFIPLNKIQKPTTILMAFSTVSLKKKNIIAINKIIIELESFNMGKGDNFQLINMVMKETVDIINKKAPTILDMVVINMSGLVNKIPPRIKNIIELISDDWFL